MQEQIMQEVGIMNGIMAPPALRIPSQSVPTSRVCTPPPPGKKRASWSAPVSPVAKKPASPIEKKKQLSPIYSPAHSTRKHVYHASIPKYNPRSHRREAPCPTHAYSTIEQELAVKPSQSVGGVKFGNTPRETHREALCPTHAYSTIEQELAVKPSQSVGGVKFGNTPRETHREALCPSHSYSTIEQELAVIPSHSVGGVKFGSTPRDVLMPVRTNCPVHVYAEAKSMLSSKASATFATDLPRRDAFQQTARSLAPVHAYAAPLSTLKTAGGVAFGSTAPRAGLLTSVSRTGLLSANITPRRTPLERPRRAAPKLAPIVAAEKVHAAEEGDGSPRDVEAIFA